MYPYISCAFYFQAIVRPALQLLQLNWKFDFITKSCILVESRSTPGGWMDASHFLVFATRRRLFKLIYR
jgi:23S rRNA U2552 (ribose-2'-O)-methylase RlmE/FtsJ